MQLMQISTPKSYSSALAKPVKGETQTYQHLECKSCYVLSLESFRDNVRACICMIFKALPLWVSLKLTLVYFNLKSAFCIWHEWKNNEMRKMLETEKNMSAAFQFTACPPVTSKKRHQCGLE